MGGRVLSKLKFVLQSLVLVAESLELFQDFLDLLLGRDLLLFLLEVELLDLVREDFIFLHHSLEFFVLLDEFLLDEVLDSGRQVVQSLQRALFVQLYVLILRSLVEIKPGFYDRIEVHLDGLVIVGLNIVDQDFVTSLVILGALLHIRPAFELDVVLGVSFLV